MQTHEILITKEPTPLVGTIDEFPKSDWTYARGHPASTDLLAIPIRSLTVTEKHIQANTERLEQGQRAMYDHDARSRKRWAVRRSILSSLSNIVPSLQYCPKVFILGRRRTNNSENDCPGDAATHSFLCISRLGHAGVPR